MKITMFSFYLTGHIQKLLGIRPSSLKPHKLAEIDGSLSEMWHTKWRLDHVVSFTDQHLLIAVNELTSYSFLIPIFKSEGIEEVMNAFHHYWFDTLIKHGYMPMKKQAIKTQYLRGGNSRAVSNLSQLSYHAFNGIDRGKSILDVHAHLRGMPMKFDGKYDIPDAKFKLALDTNTPQNLKKIPIPLLDNTSLFPN
jgi:hypothetical protein